MTSASFDNLVPAGHIDVEAAIAEVAAQMHRALPDHETTLAVRAAGVGLAQSGARWKAACRAIAEACMRSKSAVAGNANPKPPLTLHVCHPSLLPMPFAIGPDLIGPLRIFVGGYSGLALAPDRVVRTIGLAITPDDTTEGWVLTFEQQQFDDWCSGKRKRGEWPLKRRIEDPPPKRGRPGRTEEIMPLVRALVDANEWSGTKPLSYLADLLLKRHGCSISDKPLAEIVDALHAESGDDRYRRLKRPRRAATNNSE